MSIENKLSVREQNRIADRIMTEEEKEMSRKRHQEEWPEENRRRENIVLSPEQISMAMKLARYYTGDTEWQYLGDREIGKEKLKKGTRTGMALYCSWNSLIMTDGRVLVRDNEPDALRFEEIKSEDLPPEELVRIEKEIQEEKLEM